MTHRPKLREKQIKLTDMLSRPFSKQEGGSVADLTMTSIERQESPGDEAIRKVPISAGTVVPKKSLKRPTKANSNALATFTQSGQTKRTLPELDPELDATESQESPGDEAIRKVPISAGTVVPKKSLKRLTKANSNALATFTQSGQTKRTLPELDPELDATELQESPGNLAVRNVSILNATDDEIFDLSPNGSSKPIMTVKSLKSVKFPKNSQSRSFQLHWLEKWSWLEYSVAEDATFCFACRLFNLNTTKERTYTVTGYRDWAHASSKTGGYTKHGQTVAHIQAMVSWNELLNREKNKTSVSELLTHHVLEKRRYYMRAVIETILFLITNEVAFRGNWDKEYHKEDGLFRNLFEFKLKDNKHLRECQEVMPRNSTYMSPEIQNELIEIIAKIIQKEIIKEINSSDVNHFTLMADGTKDRKNKEIVSIVIRYVLHAQPIESLLWFETTNLFDAESQADLILKLLTTCDLALDKLISQCYDGAFVMSGDKGGIQRIVQQILGRIIPYVHCYNHKLHLVIIAAVESNDIVRQFFDTLKLVYNFFRRAKVQTVYAGSAILNLITTRWAGHHRSTNAMYKNYEEVVKTLLLIMTDTKKFDTDDIATATGITSMLRKIEFTFMLIFMNKFLNLLSPADKILQSTDIGFREAIPIIENVKSEILELRSNESFNSIWKESEKLLQDVSTNLESQHEERPRRNAGRPASLADFIVTHRIGERNSDFKVEISSAYYFVIDIFLSEIEKRFENNTDILSAISMVGEFDLTLLKPLEDVGIILPSQEEMVVAKNYITTRRAVHQEKLNQMDAEEGNLFKNRFNLLKELYQMREAFPAVYHLMATIDTFGCSTSTCERSFSALDRLNPKSRMSMQNARLRHLSFLAFEKKRLENISIDDVLKMFDKNPKRRIQLY